MVVRRHYINNAPVTSLSAGVTSIATVIPVVTATGFPTSFPWTGVIDAGTASAEEVLVTSAAGLNLTVTRAYDGSSASSHVLGAVFAHVATQLDYDEANVHHLATTAVHGVAASLVGTTDVQTLSNKTLSAPVLSGTTTAGPINVAGAVAATGAVSGTTGTFSAAVSGTTGTFTGAVAGTSGTFSAGVSSTTATHTGASTAASYTANGNGAVSGVVVPKTFANEAAATAAVVTPVAGMVVYLTAPTTPNTIAGLFTYRAGAWTPVETNPPLFVGNGGAVTAIPHNSFSQFPFASVVDTHNGYTVISAAIQEYVIPIDGWYEVKVRQSFTSNSTGARAVGFGFGPGTPFVVPSSVVEFPVSSNVAFSTVQSSTMVSSPAGTNFQFLAFQNSGVALNNIPGGTEVSVRWVHAR